MSRDDFRIYHMRFYGERAEYMKRMHPNLANTLVVKKVVCFTGPDTLLGESDPEYWRSVAKEIMRDHDMSGDYTAAVLVSGWGKKHHKFSPEIWKGMVSL